MFSKELLKGTIKPLILKVLTERESMYGYEIVQRVKELSKGKINVKEGSLYPILHSLKAEGILSCKSVFIGERERKYYSISRSGKGMVNKKIEELQNFAQLINTMINSKRSFAK